MMWINCCHWHSMHCIASSWRPMDHSIKGKQMVKVVQIPVKVVGQVFTCHLTCVLVLWLWRLSRLHCCFTFAAPRGASSQITAWLIDFCARPRLNCCLHDWRPSVECIQPRSTADMCKRRFRIYSYGSSSYWWLEMKSYFCAWIFCILGENSHPCRAVLFLFHLFCCLSFTLTNESFFCWIYLAYLLLHLHFAVIGVYLWS